MLTSEPRDWPSPAGDRRPEAASVESAGAAAESGAAAGAVPAAGKAAGRGDRALAGTNPVKCYLSLVIPAYNEENRLPQTLVRIAEYMALRDISYELVVVDDGSRDGTREIVRQFSATHEWVRLSSYDDEHGKPLNRGKGYAVRRGVLDACGRDILFTDADLSTPIEEMEKLLSPISAGDCDIAIASRAMPESRLAIHQPWYREWMGRTFNKFVQRVAVPGIVDTQCGFKAFRGDVAKRLFGMAQIDGFGFDTEILFLAQKFGYKVSEIGVKWEHRDDSRVNPLTAPLSMLRELFTVRLNDIRRLYDGPLADDAGLDSDSVAGSLRP